MKTFHLFPIILFCLFLFVSFSRKTSTHSQCSKALPGLAPHPPPLWPRQIFSSSRSVTPLGFALLSTYKAQCSFFPQVLPTPVYLSHLSLNVAFSAKTSILLHIRLDVLVTHNHNTRFITFISLGTTETEEELL